MTAMSTAATIADRLETTFAREGFAAPGVAALHKAAGVTIRTLYRHFPSREDMVVGALRHRHDRYLEGLARGARGSEGRAAVLSIFDAVAAWMTDETSTGCLFAQAQAAHPHSDAITTEVARYRDAVRALFAAGVDRACPGVQDAEKVGLRDALFLLHEGQVQAGAVIGAGAARDAARAAAAHLLEASGG